MKLLDNLSMLGMVLIVVSGTLTIMNSQNLEINKFSFVDIFFIYRLVNIGVKYE